MLNSLNPATWTWITGDADLFCSTVAAAAVTYMAIIVAVGTSRDSERSAQRQMLSSWRFQQRSDEEGLAAQEARSQARLQQKRLQLYALDYGAWHVLGQRNDGGRLQAPAQQDQDKFGAELARMVHAADSHDPEFLVGDSHDPLSCWPEVAGFLRACIARHEGEESHDRIRETHSTLQERIREGPGIADLTRELEVQAAQMERLHIQRVHLEEIGHEIAPVPYPWAGLAILSFGCVALPLFCTLVDFQPTATRVCVAGIVGFALLGVSATVIESRAPRAE